MKSSIQRSSIVLSILALAVASGCAHSSHVRGSVALKHSAQEADVCIGSNEIKEGDKVALFKNKCTGANAKGIQRTCEKIKLGEGTVLRVIDEHYSTITIAPGVSFDEGTVVEKQ